MKLKLGIIALIFLAAVPISIVIYYRLDPELLAKISFYLDLANPSVRIVKLTEGLRKEEVADLLSQKLDWSEGDKLAFLEFSRGTKNPEGQYFPKTYLIHKDEEPAKVGDLMFTEYRRAVEKAKPKSASASVLNEENVLKIASLIQREAAGKGDMALISGILWNRVWSEMKLQVDATLQYAKGSEENDWWPSVSGKDRKIKSPYNTYLHDGLPPTPISNPGTAAIYAAYHPAKTSCLFFLHDKNRQIHCTKTYEEHKKNIERYLK
ncbi:MAG: endolytic transglycosylase MltG [Patescibacteria group bacterium]